jgi:DNA-binding NtrC family response regulator
VHGYERILVVDDDADLAQVLTIGLNRYGYEVLSLSDPLKALKLFDDLPERWDLVISDQVMPGMAGLELIAAMKQRQPGLRAILYTGFDEGVTEAAAMQHGVDVLLHKPLSPQTLAVHIRKAMADRR